VNQAGGSAQQTDGLDAASERIDLRALLASSQVNDVLDELDRELIGLKPLKARVRDIASLLLIERARAQLGLVAGSPSLHMSFTGNPGTGKTTVAKKMGSIFHSLGFLPSDEVVQKDASDLIAQYEGEEAKAIAGVRAKYFDDFAMTKELHFFTL